MATSMSLVTTHTMIGCHGTPVLVGYNWLPRTTRANLEHNIAETRAEFGG